MKAERNKIMDRKEQELELYAHIPFCVRKCGYCDFLSGTAEESTREAYLLALAREIRRAGQDGRRKKERTRLATPYVCRGHVRESLDEAGRAVAYDRLALMAVSGGKGEKGREEVTVKNYMQ